MASRYEDKKTREKRLINLVYADADYASVLPAEAPDFTIKQRHADTEFGVEVTEFYYTEAQARAANIPDYIGEILNGGRHRHKDDLAALKVQRVTIIPGDDTRPRQEVDAIVQEFPKVDQWVSRVADRIENHRRFCGQTQSYLETVQKLVIPLLSRNPAVARG